MNVFPWNRLAMPLLAIALVSGCATSGGGSGVGRGAGMSGEEVEMFDSAMVFINKEQYSQGIEQLEVLTGKTRKSAIPFINLAIAYSKQGELEKARENLEIALEIEPDNPVANNEYGLVLRKTGHFVEARKTYEKVLTKYPEFALANKNLGVLCDVYLRDYRCALEAYRAYSAAVPEDEDAEMWVSDLEWRVKQQGG